VANTWGVTKAVAPCHVVLEEVLELEDPHVLSTSDRGHSGVIQ